MKPDIRAALSVPSSVTPTFAEENQAEYTARVLFEEGKSAEEVLVLLRQWNCKTQRPPLPDDELLRIARALKTADPEREPPPLTAPVENPRILAREALYGLAGEIVEVVNLYTEADPAAVLVNILVRFGCAVGSAPCFFVGDTRHAANEFALIVGDTASARKGTSESSPRRLFGEADPDFERRVVSGLSSGEGIIHAVRDERRDKQPVKEGGRVVEYQEVVVDHGIEDKRLLIVENEFAQALTVLAREGNTLGPVLRNAWDGGRLTTLTKNSGETATRAHVSVLGHITKHELLRKLAEGDAFNGFLNRFLILEVSRSKLLPEGARPPENVMQNLAQRLASALNQARQVGEMRRDDEAKALWATAYTEMEKPQPGLYGAIRARGSAHVLRLSMIYALMDGEGVIRRPHLEAALAVWDYAEASIRRIFGDRTGDGMADRIVDALAGGPLTEREVHDLFGRNAKAARLHQALTLLRDAGRIEAAQAKTGGRPSTAWQLTKETN
jgi:hypothetical protein